LPDKQHRTLYQVVNYLRGLIEERLANKWFWLKAELSNINFHSSGHCYIDLVQTKEGKTIAQCRAMIWANDLINIKNELGPDFGNILKKGAEILCFVNVSFSEVYGVSITIANVDKSFAVGELERKKQETYKKIKEEGLLEKNKVHRLPIVIQNIAIVGSPSTNGYIDVVKQLQKNEYGYVFYLTNFACQVQGDKAEKEIISKLKELENSKHDAILLVRGGGSKLDLEVFNSYELAKTIAFHSKPILTGIGHETDINIADLVAKEYFKTPSALGAHLVANNHNYDIRVQTAYSNIRKIFDLSLQKQKHRIRQGALDYKNVSISYTQLRRGRLHQMGNRIFATVREKISISKQKNSVAKQVIVSGTQALLQNKKSRLTDTFQLCSVRAKQISSDNARSIGHKKELLILYVNGNIKRENDFIGQASNIIPLYHPDKTLERGYSITRTMKTVIRPGMKISKNDIIEIELVDRKLSATVISEIPKNSKWRTLITKVLQKN
jgi:exodeoxyribonuclease VII large subunit